LFKQNQFTLCFVLFNLYSAYVTILCPPSFPPMSDLCAQIRGLYCKNEGSLFWEEGKAIFCTQHEELFYFILQKTAKELVLKQGSYGHLKIVIGFGARVRKTAGTRSCCSPELLALKRLIKQNEFILYFLLFRHKSMLCLEYM